MKTVHQGKKVSNVSYIIGKNYRDKNDNNKL